MQSKTIKLSASKACVYKWAKVKERTSKEEPSMEPCWMSQHIFFLVLILIVILLRRGFGETLHHHLPEALLLGEMTANGHGAISLVDDDDGPIRGVGEDSGRELNEREVRSAAFVFERAPLMMSFHSRPCIFRAIFTGRRIKSNRRPTMRVMMRH